MSEDAEVQGVLLDLGDSRIRIARAGGSNIRFQKLYEAYQKVYGRQIELDTLDDKVQLREFISIYAKAIVLGWESGPLDEPINGIIPGPDGEDLQFNEANTIKILTDLPELFSYITKSSMEVALFRDKVKQADAKN